MATTGSGSTTNFYSAASRCKMSFSIEDSGTCSNGNRVLNYRIDRGLIRNVGGYYDGIYDTPSTMTWYVDGTQMKQWTWDVYWTIAGGRWPASGEWWLDYQTGSFESTKKNGTYTVKIRWLASGWSSNYFELSGSLYVGGCCETTEPTGIDAWVSNVKAFQITNNATITGWGTECTSDTTRAQESTICSSNSWSGSDRSTIQPSSTSTTMAYTHTGLTPNTKYWFDAAFRNKDGYWAVVRNSDNIFQYSAITCLESPTARITYLDSRSIKFTWSQNYGGKAAAGYVYYKITKRGSSDSVSGSDITLKYFSKTVSGTSTSGTVDTWSDGISLSPDTAYDLWVWSYNGRTGEVTKISFTTDRASYIKVNSFTNPLHSSVIVSTIRVNARYYDQGTQQITSGVDTGQVYLAKEPGPDTVPTGGFGQTVTHEQGYWKCRYLRVQMGRNNVDTGRYLLQWEIYDKDGTNVAPGKDISGWSNSAYAINSNFTNYASTSGTAWLTIDLGSEMEIKEMYLYPYYDARNNQSTTSSTVLASTRAFASVNVDISTNNSTWTTAYSSGSDYVVATYAGMKADGTAPGTGQAKSNLLGYRIVPNSPILDTMISNLDKNSVASTNASRLKPGDKYRVYTTATDRHYASTWGGYRATIQLPMAIKISQGQTQKSYKLKKIRPNGQTFEMTGSIVDWSQDE